MFFSQFGEDKILWRMFPRNRGTCVEVGANDGVHGSTTFFFEQRGWTCILIEPNPGLAAELRRIRAGKVFECAVSSRSGTATLQLAEGNGLAHAVSTLEHGSAAADILRRHGARARPVEVAIRRLDEVLDEAGVQRIDFITIDVEGHELEVLKGFTISRWQPSVMILEDNSRLRDRRVRDHLQGAGYRRFRRTGVNDWYASLDDRAMLGRWRKLRYARSAAAADVFLTWAALKLRLARFPGILPLARKLKGRGK